MHSCLRDQAYGFSHDATVDIHPQSQPRPHNRRPKPPTTCTQSEIFIKNSSVQKKFVNHDSPAALQKRHPRHRQTPSGSAPPLFVANLVDYGHSYNTGAGASLFSTLIMMRLRTQHAYIMQINLHTTPAEQHLEHSPDDLEATASPIDPTVGN